MPIDYTSTGRSELISLLTERDAEADRASAFILKLAAEQSELISLLTERDAEADRVSAFILKLAAENEVLTKKAENCRVLHSRIVIPGWWCTLPNDAGVPCDTFHGASKEAYTACRHCGKPKPDVTTQPVVRV